MNNSLKIYVVSTGMITSVGMNTRMTLAATRAGISAYKYSPCLNSDFHPMKISPIPEGAFELPELSGAAPLYQQVRSQRMLGMAAKALKEVMGTYVLKQPLPFFLGGPEMEPMNQLIIDGSFIAHLAEISGANIDMKLTRLIATGRPSGIQAIELAFRFIQQSGMRHVLVGGVDSLIDLYTMGTFDKDERILATGKADGFVPGEAAGFLLLSSEAGLSDFNEQAIGAISYPGIAEEKGHRYSPLPYRGDGLATAVTDSLSHFTGPKIKSLFSGMNGESFHIKEHGVAMMRNGNALEDELSIYHPVDCFGDIGAALAPVLIGLGIVGMTTGAYKTPGLVYCAAEQGARAACCIQGVA